MNPLLLFLAAWASQIFVYAIFPWAFPTLEWQTWTAIFSFVVAFVLGWAIPAWTYNKQAIYSKPEKSLDYRPGLIIFTPDLMYALYGLYTELGSPGTEGLLNLQTIRLQVINDMVGEGVLSKYFKIIYFGVFVILYAMAS